MFNGRLKNANLHHFTPSLYPYSIVVVLEADFNMQRMSRKNAHLNSIPGFGLLALSIQDSNNFLKPSADFSTLFLKSTQHVDFQWASPTCMISAPFTTDIFPGKKSGLHTAKQDFFASILGNRSVGGDILHLPKPYIQCIITIFFFEKFHQKRYFYKTLMKLERWCFGHCTS